MLQKTASLFLFTQENSSKTIMSATTNELQKALQIAEEKFEGDNTVKQFEKASKEFEKLVELGIAKKRGYNLMTIDKAHLQSVGFNTNV